MTAAPVAQGTFELVLDSVGLAIVRGELPAGHSDTIDGLITRTGASRSIVREATRVLVSLGMLTAGRRVGLRVTPKSAWDTLDAHVVRWRLASPERTQQLRELVELRLAIEPEAARVAADRHNADHARELARAIADLHGAAIAHDSAGFLDADRRLHALILKASSNALFSRLQAVVDEALRERTPSEPVAWATASSDVALHAALVEAILDGDGFTAAETMRRIARGG
jgi:DNA-binding FadR family transcriptional regulator